MLGLNVVPLFLLLAACGESSCTADQPLPPQPASSASASGSATPQLGQGQTKISQERAIAIAHAKAATVYKGPNELDLYVVTATLHADGWHVDFELPPGVVGGGPHYVIDAQSGAILRARYEQ